MLRLNPHSVVPHGPAPRWNVTRAHGWQLGGGLMISGTAALTNTNVYANQARVVCSPFELSLDLHPAPRWNVTCAHGWQDGGGLFIAGTATLTNTNVYQNEAIYVCSLLEPSVTFHPSPRWNVTCARGWQAGGGLLIDGTATLTNSNVYANQAGEVCSPFELSSSAPLEC